MQLEFIKAVQFTLLVKAGDRVREFNFRKLKKTEKEEMTVNVCNERGDRIFFTMQKDENEWDIRPSNLPAWIVQNKNNIRQGLEAELLKWS